MDSEKFPELASDYRPLEDQGRDGVLSGNTSKGLEIYYEAYWKQQLFKEINQRHNLFVTNIQLFFSVMC